MSRLLVLICFLTLSAGCSLHRRSLPESPVPLPESFSVSPGQGQAGEGEQWWKAYGSAELNRLMEEVFAGNPDLEAGRARLRQARSREIIAGSGLSPSLNLGAQAGRERSAGFGDPVTGNRYALSLGAAYEVDLWGRLDSASRASRWEAQADALDLRGLYLSLSADAADLYFLALEQRGQLGLLDESLQSLRETLELVESRYRAGLVPALDLYQARQNLAAARSGRPALVSALGRTLHALSSLRGDAAGMETSAPAGALPQAPAWPEIGLPADLLLRRPDLQAAQARLEAADLRIAQAVAARLPGVNLAASLSRIRSEGPLGTVSASLWSVLLEAAAPLLDGGRRKAEVERTRALLDESLALYRKAILTAVREVEDALAASAASEERILLLGRQLEDSEATFAVALARYRQGLSEYLPVLTAQNALFSARRELLASRRQLLSDRIALVRALGGRWMAEPSLTRND